MSEDTNPGDFTPEEATAFAAMRDDAPKVEAEQLPAGDAHEIEAEAPEIEGDAGEQDNGTVSHKALHAERSRRKELEARYAQQEKDIAVLKDRWDQLLKRAQADAAPEAQGAVDEDPEPDPNEDLFAHNAWLKRQLAKVNDKIAGQEKQTAEQRQRAEAVAQVKHRWEADAIEFHAKAPDFGDAAAWLSDLRHKQLAAYAKIDPRFADASFRDAAIDSELQNIVAQAAAKGFNSAEWVYEFAVQAGYTKKEAAAAAAGADPAAQIAKLQEAQAASKSLSAAGGRGAGEMTADALLRMSDADFDKWKSANPKRYRELMGA